jgi:hypothetical protein
MVRHIPLKAHTDTYTYSLFLLSIVKHHSSWSSSFICDNNENDFIKGDQRGSFYWTLRRFGQSHNRKFYNPVRMLRHYYERVCSLPKVRNTSSSCWVLYFLNVVILIPFVVKNAAHVTICLFFFKLTYGCLHFHITMSA